MLSSTSTSTSPSAARRSAPNADFDDYVDPLGAGVVDDGNDNDNDNDSGMMQDVTIDDGYNNNNNNNVNRSNSGVGQYMEDGYDQQVINVNSNTSKIWMILLVAIFISFFALIIGNNNHGSSSSGGVNSGTTNKSKSKTITPSVKWSIVIIIISLLICFGVNICYYFPNSSSCSKVFITTKSGRLIELILSVLIFVLWCVGLTIIMNPSNSIAVGYTQIVNGNLYIGSWICFSCIVYIVGDLLNDIFGGSQNGSQSGSQNTQGTAVGGRVNIKQLWNTRRGKWYALLASSGIVLSSSVRTYQAFDCYLSVMKSVNVCVDTTVGITMSVIGGILAVIFSCISGLAVSSANANAFAVVATTTHNTHNNSGGGGTRNNNNDDGMNNTNNNNNTNIARLIESVGSVVTTIVWTIAWGFITFGEGPGHSLGNLYFSTWAAFIISILITTDCFHDCMVNNRIISSMKNAIYYNSEVVDEEQQQVHQIELASSSAATGDNIDVDNIDDI